MVGRIGKKGAERVSVKMEVVSGMVVANLVKWGPTFIGVRKEVELAVKGGGARVTRLVGQGNPSVRGCFISWDRGHVQHVCLRGGAVGMGSGRTENYWRCGGVGHYLAECSGRSLPVAGADGSFSRSVFRGGLKRGGGDLAGAPVGRGGSLRGGSVLEYVNRSRAPVGGAPQGAR